MDDLEVKRFAVKYDPPTLVVEYKTSDGALFLKKIRIKVKAKMVSTIVCSMVRASLLWISFFLVKTSKLTLNWKLLSHHYL